MITTTNIHHVENISLRTVRFPESDDCPGHDAIMVKVRTEDGSSAELTLFCKLDDAAPILSDALADFSTRNRYY